MKGWHKFDVNCFICNSIFEIKEYNVNEPKKEKYYCSRSCANTRIHDQKTKNKISKSIKKLINDGNSFGVLTENYKDELLDKRIYINCPVCGNEFYLTTKSNKIYCSRKCYNKDSKCEFRKKAKGGYRKNSGIGKSGWYNGIYCDSSWELAYVIYLLEHNIKFLRNKKTFKYFYNNKEYTYCPDFIVNNTFIEIKGYSNEQTNAKIKQFPFELNVLYKSDLLEIFKYVINKYGKNYIELYQDNPYNLKNNKCLNCGIPVKNMYCSWYCVGKHGGKKSKARYANG